MMTLRTKSTLCFASLLMLAMVATACAPTTPPAPTAVPPTVTPLTAPPTEAAAAASSAPTAVPAAISGDISGAELFRLSCATCHGADAAGQTFTMDDQTIQTPSLKWDELVKLYAGDASRGTPEQQLASAIIKGQDEAGDDLNAMMPRWENLTSTQVDSLAQHLKSGAAVPDTLTGAAASLQGEALFQAACAACHGADGMGKTFTKDNQSLETPSLSWSELVTLYTDASRGTPEQQLALAITKGQDETGDDLNAMMPQWTIFSQAQVDSLVEYIKATFK